jgi:uncharacterized membrane protein YiaA
MEAKFTFQEFFSQVNPVLMVIAGISLFVGIVVLAFGIMTTKGKSEERESFFSNMIWVVIGAFTISSAAAITGLFFK